MIVVLSVWHLHLPAGVKSTDVWAQPVVNSCKTSYYDIYTFLMLHHLSKMKSNQSIPKPPLKIQPLKKESAVKTLAGLGTSILRKIRCFAEQTFDVHLEPCVMNSGQDVLLIVLADNKNRSSGNEGKEASIYTRDVSLHLTFTHSFHRESSKWVDLNEETCTHIKIVPGQLQKLKTLKFGVFVFEKKTEFPGFFVWISGLDLLYKPTQLNSLKLT